MNKTALFLKIIIISMIVCIFTPSMIYASTSYGPETYTYSYTQMPIDSPPAYIFQKTVRGDDFGIGAFNEPSCIDADIDGNIYISDTGNNRVVCLDKNWNIRMVISEYEYNGIKQVLNQPTGVFVRQDGAIYIADTGSKKILIFNQKGEVLNIINEPASDLFPEGFIYSPSSVCADMSGRIYIVSRNTGMGIITLSEEGKFEGFIGAQRVVPNMADIFWRLFMTAEQKKRIRSFVPTEYNNLTIDSMGLIYVTTNAIDPWLQYLAVLQRDRSGSRAPIKRLNPTGIDVLQRNGAFPPAGDLYVEFGSSASAGYGPSSIIDVALGEQDTYSILDSKRNKIFTYDYNGNLLFAFGGSGFQKGTFKSVQSISYQGSNLLVVDGAAGSITVFERSEYGDTVIAALKLQGESKYEEAAVLWNEILLMNGNFELAYDGIANSLMKQNRFSEAKEYYRMTNNIIGYSRAYKEERNIFLQRFILVIPAALIIFVLLLSRFGRYARRKNREGGLRRDKRTLKDELIYVFHLITHPFDGVWDLKHENRGSLRAAMIFVLLAVLTFIYNKAGLGYVFRPIGDQSVDIIGEAYGILLPFLLWCIANWSLTTLMDGEGSFKDIVKVSAYGLFPIIILNIPITFLSNFMVSEEAFIIGFVRNISYAWAFALIFFGVMVIHGYSLLKNIVTTIFSIVGMGIIMFLAMVFMSVSGKMVSFIVNIIEEMMFRI